MFCDEPPEDECYCEPGETPAQKAARKIATAFVVAAAPALAKELIAAIKAFVAELRAPPPKPRTPRKPRAKT